MATAEKSYVDMMRRSRQSQSNVAVGLVVDAVRKAPRKTLPNVKKTSKRTRAKSRLRISQDSHIVSVPGRVSKRQRHIKRTASMAKKKTKRVNGRFAKANPRKRAKKRAAPKRRSAKRRSAPKKRKASGRSKAKRRAAMRKPAPRKISKRLKRAASGEFKARRRHKVRPYTRKTKSGRSTRVKTHMSYEEVAAPNPRRRPRRRARAREEVVQEMYTANPRKRKAKKRKAARRAPKRRRAAKRRRNPTRRSRSASIPAKTRRRVRGRTVTRPASVRIVLTDKRGSRRSSKRRSTKRSYKKKGRGKKRKGSRRGSSRPRLPPASAMMENPLGYGGFGMEEYALENPLTGGELALAFVSGGLGFVAGSMLDRYIATRAGNTGVAGVTPGAGGTLSNGAAIAAAPGIMRILAQAALGAVFILPAHFVQQPMGRAALQGASLGVGVRLAGQLLESYVIQKFFGLASDGVTPTAFGARYYPIEIASTTLAATLAAAAAATPPTTPAGTLPVGTAGIPRRALPFGTRPVQQRVQTRGVGAVGPCGLNGSCGGTCGGGCGGYSMGPNGQGTVIPGNCDPEARPDFMPASSCAPCATQPPSVPVAPPPPPLSGLGRVPMYIGHNRDQDD
jgi:hypothetical protein